MFERIIKFGMVAYLLLMLGIGVSIWQGRNSDELPPIAYAVERGNPEVISQYVIDLQQRIHTRIYYEDSAYTYSPNGLWQYRADYSTGTLNLISKQRHTNERTLASFDYISSHTRIFWQNDSSGIFVLNKLAEKAMLQHIAVPSGTVNLIGAYDMPALPSRIRGSETGRYLTFFSYQYGNDGILIDTQSGETMPIPNTRYTYWADDDRYTVGFASDDEEQQLINFNKLVMTYLPTGTTSKVSIPNRVLNVPVYRSPDGSRLAVNMNTGGVLIIHPETNATTIVDNAYSTQWGWSPDGERLIIMQHSDTVFDSRYAIVNVDTGETVYLLRGRSNRLQGYTMRWSNDGAYVMLYQRSFMAEQPLKIVDSSTGETMYEGTIYPHLSDDGGRFYWYQHGYVP